MSVNDEIPLAGGNTNTVIKRGDTVRRRLSPHSPTLHRYLRHLADQGFEHAPKVLGIDTKGREILGYIAGDTTEDASVWDTAAAVDAAAKLLRALHDASTSFVRPSATWAISDPDPTQHEVICHHDFAPYNMVFRDGLPHAIVDFDLCGPGPRLRDLAYLAYWVTPLSFAAPDLHQRRQTQTSLGYPRLKQLCAAYGTNDLSGVINMVSTVLHHMADPAAMAAALDQTVADRLNAEGHLAHWAREAAAFDLQRPSILSILAPQ